MTTLSSRSARDRRTNGPGGAAAMSAVKRGTLFARLVRSAVPSGCSTGGASPRDLFGRGFGLPEA
jgi:hypothetical protein